MRVLVLDQCYRPLSIIGWADAFTAVFSGKAEVVSYSNQTVRSANAEHAVPSIIRYTRRAVWRTTRLRFNRTNLWSRDRGTCQYCGVPVPRTRYTYDHILPSSRGGPTTWENIVCCCQRCNSLKANKTPEEAKMTLLTQPRVPTALIGLRSIDYDVPEDWAMYI